jgi:hypothetical protein
MSAIGHDFKPTLIDTRFILQTSLSVTATVLANILLRTVVENLLLL